MELIPRVPSGWTVPSDFVELVFTIRAGDATGIEKHHCSFCATPTTKPITIQGWYVCDSGHCCLAREAQIERMEACLIDCPETRRDALRWSQVKCGQ